MESLHVEHRPGAEHGLGEVSSLHPTIILLNVLTQITDLEKTNGGEKIIRMSDSSGSV